MPANQRNAETAELDALASDVSSGVGVPGDRGQRFRDLWPRAKEALELLLNILESRPGRPFAKTALRTVLSAGDAVARGLASR
jgi:hypothetical protein